MTTPINMVLHCPDCGMQHVDAPNEHWTNPPHRSHLCANCGHIWRPADVPTNGVARTITTGKNDSPWRAPVVSVGTKRDDPIGWYRVYSDSSVDCVPGPTAPVTLGGAWRPLYNF